MTDPTTTPTPPQELTDAQLDALERQHWKVESNIEYEPGAGFAEALDKHETFQHRAFARAAIAADRAARVELVPPQELTDERLLELARYQLGFEGPIVLDEYEKCGAVVDFEVPQLLAFARAAIAAHEAARPAPAPVPTFLDAIRLANGCHDYSGGYLCEAADVYHAGITTVVNVLRKAAVGPWDSQTNAVFAMGSACLKTPAPTPEDVETRFRSWWAESFPNAPAGPHAVRSHVAFALHLLGGEVQ